MIGSNLKEYDLWTCFVVDILHFACLSFTASIKLLSEQHRFAKGVIQKVYKQPENHAEAMDTTKMMWDDAEEWAVAEILKGHEGDSNKGLEENKNESVKNLKKGKGVKGDQDEVREEQD
ncbi:hypothetical protein EDB19DRAFT_1834047 [Suillus lakei]|nr:hypothetical protein EDB19DRAFT_1834047 [Suillus lakei]